jgi:transposase
MDRYIGLDGHTQSCTLAVIGPSGKRLKSGVVETSGQALVEWIRTVPRQRHLCLEEGTQSSWLYEVLEPHVDEIVVVQPAKREGPKSDARDAWVLAEQLRRGSLDTRVFKACGEFGALRVAIRAHGMLVQDVTRVKNRLKAVFRGRGIEVDDGLYDCERRERWLKELPIAHRPLAELLAQELDHLEPLRSQASALLQGAARPHRIVRVLATAPGMGPIRTAQLVGLVVTPERFRTRRQFWSYCGLGVVTRSSADWLRKDGKWVRSEVRQTRGLNRNRQPLLKSVFKGAATTVIGLMHADPLYADYVRMLEAGTKPNLAKLTLARRIAATVLSMWKHEEEYDPKRRARDKRP